MPTAMVDPLLEYVGRVYGRLSPPSLRAEQLAGQPKRAALGVSADCPLLPRVDDAPAERRDPLQRLGDIDDREVGQREGIAWATSARMYADRRPRVRLPALSLRTFASLQLNSEKLAPEAPRPLGIVSRELDEGQR